MTNELGILLQELEEKSKAKQLIIEKFIKLVDAYIPKDRVSLDDISDIADIIKFLEGSPL